MAMVDSPFMRAPEWPEVLKLWAILLVDALRSEQSHPLQLSLNNTGHLGLL